METDLQWLRDLHAKSWKIDPPQYSAGRQTSYGHASDLPVSKDDADRFAWICETYRNELIFEPGSGVFGFGISISVYLHKPAPFPNVPEENEALICMTGKQLFPMENCHNRTASYTFVEALVYTKHNRKARELAGFKQPLRDLSYYDY